MSERIFSLTYTRRLKLSSKSWQFFRNSLNGSLDSPDAGPSLIRSVRIITEQICDVQTQTIVLEQHNGFVLYLLAWFIASNLLFQGTQSLP